MNRLLPALLAFIWLSLTSTSVEAQFRREAQQPAETQNDPWLVSILMSHRATKVTNEEFFVEFSSDSRTLYVGAEIGPVPTAPIGKLSKPSPNRITRGVVESVRNEVDGGSMFPKLTRPYPSDRQAQAISAFRVEDGALLRQFVCVPPRGTEEKIRSADLSPDGKYLAGVGAGNRHLYLFDAATGKQLAYCETDGARNNLYLHRTAFVLVDETPYVLTETNDALYLHRIPDCKIVDTIDVSDGKFDCQGDLSATPDGKLFALGTSVWDATSAKLLSHRPQSSSYPFGLISPSGQEVLLAEVTPVLRWDRSDNKPRAGFDYEAKQRITALAISGDEKWLAVARGHVISNDQVTIDLFEFKTERHVRRVEGHVSTVHALAFSPDGKLLASVSLDGSTRLWKVSESD